MKKILILSFISLLFGGCDDNMKFFSAELTLMRSFIPMYEESALSIRPLEDATSISEKCYLYCSIFHEDLEAPHVVYKAPELGATGKEAERFLESAERNGDRSYNTYENIAHWSGRRCGSDNYMTMHVKCLNAAWDDAHPVGSLLDDIIRIRYYSYADYVRNGYPKGRTPNMKHHKSLTDTTEDDLCMLSSGISLYFASAPPAGTYEMEVTLVTTDGEEKTATCTLAIE